MRKVILLFIAAIISICLVLSPSLFHKSIIATPLEATAIKEEPVNEEEDGMEKAIEQEIRLTKDLKLNRVPTERLLIAKKMRDQKLALHSSTRLTSSVSGINWQERGPNNIGGRTRALIFDLNDAANGYKKVWAGGVGGGLWYCNDITVASPTWNKVDDFLDNIAITSIAQNPLNPLEIYIGTGEGWFNLDAIRGLGIWKSSDGGVTWSRLMSTAGFNFINKLIIDKNGAL